MVNFVKRSVELLVLTLLVRAEKTILVTGAIRQLHGDRQNSGAVVSQPCHVTQEVGNRVSQSVRVLVILAARRARRPFLVSARWWLQRATATARSGSPGMRYRLLLNTLLEI
jgi:hypothetical protein